MSPIDLVRKVTAALRDHRLVDSGAHVLVAVSGGADSVALLAALAELAEGWPFRLTAWHLDHGLRDEVEAARDQGLVERLACNLRVGLVIEHTRVEPGGNVEARARAARYAMMERAAEALGCASIAVAHTQNDQAETVLLRLLRGAGSRGLGAMAHRRGRIVRPLLDCSRDDVLAFVRARGLSWVEDSTNADPRFARNRIRHQVLPALVAHAGAGVIARLAETASLLREESAILDEVACEHLERVRAGEVLDASRIGPVSAPLSTRILRAWLARARGTLRGISRRHIAVLARALVTTESGRLALPGGFVTYEARTLRWAPHPPAAVAGFSHPIAPGECVCRPDLGWELELGAPEPWGSHRGLPSGPSLAVFDAAHLPAALEVRSMQPGDRIRPMGVAGRQKLQDLFTDHKVARSRRTLWPALAAGQEVLWVPELRRGSAALVGPTTAAVVRARFRRDRDPS